MWPDGLPDESQLSTHDRLSGTHTVLRELAERIEEISQFDGAGRMLKSLVDR
jgi:hypothetical protein